MQLAVTTDAGCIVAALDPLIAADPVRHTVLGSVRAILASGAGDGWCAARPDGSALAVRSDRNTPVVLAGDWPTVQPLVSLLRELPTFVGLTGPVGLVDAVRAGMELHGHRVAERLFRLDRLATPDRQGGDARPTRDDDRTLLVAWFRAFGEEALGLVSSPEESVDRLLRSGCIWLWTVDEEPVSMAARRSPVAGVARIGPVYTPPDRWGRGYGSAVTAAATADILALGAVPVLFTDLANPVSNAIYQRLGYRPVDDFAHLSLT